MSSAVNHRKRSHRSQKSHYEANTRRMVSAKHHQEQGKQRSNIKKFFERMFRRNSTSA